MHRLLLQLPPEVAHEIVLRWVIARYDWWPTTLWWTKVALLTFYVGLWRCLPRA